MVWIEDPAARYSFTIARLLEGFLRIDNLIVNGWNMIVGGIDQGLNLTIHPGDTVNMDLVVSNQGQNTDNFIIEVYKDAAVFSTSPIISNLAIGGTSSFAPPPFVMPNANVALEIRTFHEE